MPDDANGTTVADLHRETTRSLREAFAGDDRLETASRDARLIVAHALDLPPDRIVVAGDGPVEAAAVARVRELAVRRAAGAPVSRLLGRRAFYGRDFAITGATLDPRPDTECVVDAVLERIDSGPGRAAPLRILDLGTGSGILIVTLLAELPSATGIGTDIAPAAVACAGVNADMHGVANRVRFVVGDWAEPIGERFGVVVSNPPYIVSETVAALAPEVREHDPQAALDGGADGLDAYRRILPEMIRLLAPNGFAVLEIGYDQAAAVSMLATQATLEPTIGRDLAGRDRTIALVPAARELRVSPGAWKT